MTILFQSIQEVASSINDGDKIILGGFIGSVVPEAIEKELEKRFLSSGHPKNLELYFAAGQGDAKDRANNCLGHENMTAKVIGGHWGLVPKLQQLAIDNKIIAYNFPQGVISHLIRDSAAGKPGTITHVGLGTFVDPRLGGGKLNEKTTEDLVSLMKIEDEEYLFYKAIKPNVAILRGTKADTHGNITMEDECLVLENLAAAQLVSNNGGKVIVQVKEVVEYGSFHPQMVRIPGIFVDVVTVCEDPKLHMQTFSEQQNPDYCQQNSQKMGKTQNKARVLDVKKVVARRAALELRKGSILNYGIGVPEVISEVTDEEGVTDEMIATVEPGAIGGTPAGGLSFGASAFPEAVITQDQMFDFYDGGGIDQAFLGLAECDIKGNLNVSRFGPKIAGCGGFINITQNSKQVYFCGTFTAGKSKITIEDGKLNIEQDGSIKKFIQQVQQITFSAENALKNHKQVLYITERAVFKLAPDVIELIEIAPGVDLERDILAKMDFIPTISSDLKLMDARIFMDKPMGLVLQSK